MQVITFIDMDTIGEIVKAGYIQHLRGAYVLELWRFYHIPTRNIQAMSAGLL